ncbi:MAG: hypothetical protein LLG14_20510 [Nocardiaceae bacterium]|nr:hypothetical protein [Nocardiaceae bacterium]
MVNVSNSFVATPPIDGGVLFTAPLGTALPTTAIASLNAAFKDLGAVGEDGIKQKIDRKTKDIKMFGGENFRTVQEEYTSEMTITLLEDDNLDVIKLIYGDANVTVGTATVDGLPKTIYQTSQPLPIKSFVAKCIDGQKTKTYVIQKGQVVDVKEIQDVHNDATQYEVTIKCYRSTSGNGEAVLQLRNDASITS